MTEVTVVSGTGPASTTTTTSTTAKLVTGTGAVTKTGLPRVRNKVDAGIAFSSNQPSIWVGDGAPTIVPGAIPGHEYLDALTGIIYELGVNMADWTPVANIKGPPGSLTLQDSERLALIDAASAEAAQDLIPPIDLTVLLENALQEG